MVNGEGSYAHAKRTKIVCTIGPASSSKAVLKDMMAAGMNVARINFSHGSYESNLKLLETVREAAEESNQVVTILQDLQGPRIRVGALPEGGLELIDGHMATLQAGVVEAELGIIPVPYDRLAADVKKGDRILLEDGTKELEVVDVRGKKIRANVLLGGRLLAHKGINVPTATLSAEAITEKDEQDLAFGLKQNIDYVALSFVRGKEDILQLREKIKRALPDGAREPGVIVKIEKHEAIVNFDEILTEVDAVMIARGDLGLETPVSLLPLRQKKIIEKCLLVSKPVITATEMLGSMQFKPRPTRAEVTDVANAVIDHTDALMLSGETAMGKYPVRAVALMSEIAEKTEESTLDDLLPEEEGEESLPRVMAFAAVAVARRVDAKAIVVTTKSGFSARAVASFRPEIPVFAATQEERTRNQLQMSWGITPLLIEGYSEPEKMVQMVLSQIVFGYGLSQGDPIVVVSGLKKNEGGPASPAGKFDSAVRVVQL